MTFTDEDLKQLKDDIEKTEKSGDCIHILTPHLKALLARLEAAERNMGGHSEKCSKEQCLCSKKDRELAWRKLAGK